MRSGSIPLAGPGEPCAMEAKIGNIGIIANSVFFIDLSLQFLSLFVRSQYLYAYMSGYTQYAKRH